MGIAQRTVMLYREKLNAQPTAGTINIIVGGIASEGDTSSGRKQYARQHAHTPRKSRDEVKDITFRARDLEGISYPHDDALVISAVVANLEVKRILVDNGSGANILSQKAFARMGISPKQLKAVKIPLQGFGGGVIIPEGIVELSLILGIGNTQVTEITPFQVVNTPMAYNIILGRPLLNKIQAIVSTFHLAIKFPTGHGIGVVRGDQTAARQCYVTSIRGMSVDVMQLADLELDLEPRGRLAPVEHGKVITIGRDLKANLREEVIDCLSRNIDIFAWKVEDMPGIDPKVAVYRLNISPGAKPVKQRKRQFTPKRLVVIQEEVSKLVRVGFIKEVQYPDWLANVVLVKKASNKWRVCSDFTDLNKACPKDSYPLPRIDNLMNNTSGHKLVIPFGLKNAEATYQRLINKVFVDLIGKNIEAYVDHMVVKSKKVEQHISNLEEVFVTLRKYKIKLNSEKCVFDVVSGKFLGFMITHRGIEANPDKIQVLAAMEPPRTKKEV
ncbi:uncharacterized protein LOC111369122 [Olea europaea var. sylvestris]|uniref:uncharacterized protein LOC111369122 n=1 Tax=Olea europaea var. sylvestris TaxID=158386 RepID=UPI000C1CDBCD|nr:uncharacterized protein LOC111369122 [Olea europaea var. sylvestris]